MEFYFIEISDVCGYDLIATGRTPKETINNAWKYYRSAGDTDFTSKKEWLKWHGVCEASCCKRVIGEVWYE